MTGAGTRGFLSVNLSKKTIFGGGGGVSSQDYFLGRRYKWCVSSHDYFYLRIWGRGEYCKPFFLKF